MFYKLCVVKKLNCIWFKIIIFRLLVTLKSAVCSKTNKKFFKYLFGLKITTKYNRTIYLILCFLFTLKKVVVVFLTRFLSFKCLCLT